jgi:hypothetical protein
MHDMVVADEAVFILDMRVCPLSNGLATVSQRPYICTAGSVDWISAKGIRVGYRCALRGDYFKSFSAADGAGR